jgi:hypothetical protein
MKRIWKVHNLAAGILLLLISLAGCRGEEPSATSTPRPLFVPPTSDAASNPEPESLPSPTPTKQGKCVNQLRFLEDLTIPDGTEVKPGKKITKRWLISNEGSCNWNQSYSLRLISGLTLGAKKSQALYPAQQGTEAVLEITFTAPENPGRYNSWWQAFDPQGKRFGDPVYMDITVVSK